MIYIYSLFFFIGLFPFGLKTAAQKPNIIPPSPNAASFTKYGDIPVNLSSGTLNLQIPIYKASEGSLDCSIALDYNYTGFRPADAASWVGRGWNIPLGAITRTVHGLRDEGSNVIGYDGYLLTGNTVKTTLESFESQTLTNLSFIADVVAGTKDAEPDIFNFSFAGYNGKFFFGHDGTIHTTSDQPFKITYVLSDPIDSGSGHQFVGTTFTKWTIETADGSKYIFNNAEYSWSLFSGEEFDREKKTTSAWYLSEIIGPKGESIKFTYTSPSDQYARVQASYAQKRSMPLQNSMQSCSNLNFSATNSDGLQKNISEEIFLETIRGSNWEMRFNSSQHTDEIDGGTSNFRKLNNIQVVDISQSSAGQVLKTFEFMYNGTSSNFELTQLQEKNGSTLVNPYLFTYNAGAFSLLSRNIDYWGFYNGSSNNDNLIPEYGANRHPSLPHTLTGALSSVRYPTTGHSTFEYELNTASFIQNQPFVGYNVVVQSYPYSWANVNGTMTLLVDSPFTLTDSSDYDALVSVSTGTLPEDCSALQSSGTLPPGTYSAANFMDHKCLQQNEYPLNHGPSVMVWVRRRTKTLKTEVGGLRIKKISNYTGLGALATVKEYFYDDFSDSTRSSGVLVDSINTSSTTYATFCGQQIGVRTYQSTPIHSMSLTPLNYYNVEERIQGSRQFHNFLSYNDGYPDNYGAVMLGLINTRLLGPIESYDFARSRPEIITSYRGTLANKASVSTSTYTPQAGLVKYLAPAIYAEQIATYNQSVDNNLNVTSTAEYYVKAYRVIDGWIKKESETSIDYGTSGNGTEVATSYFYDNSLHKQLTRQRTTQSDGTIEEKKIRYPQDFGSSSSRAPYIQSMIDLHMLAYPIEQTTILEKSASDRRVIDASVTTYKSFTGNSLRPALVLPYKTFTYNGRNGSIGAFVPYDSSGNQTASTSYREILEYTHYDTQGNPLSLLANQGEKISYLWSYKGQYPVAEMLNVDHTTLTSAMGGTSFEQMKAMTESAAIQTKLDAVRAALTGNNAASSPLYQMKSYLYSPLNGVSVMTDATGKSFFYEYDGVGRLAYIKNGRTSAGSIRAAYCYNYMGQNIPCNIPSPAAANLPTLTLLPDITATLSETLVAFNAIREEDSALLTWNTTVETNSDHFDVEHSLNGKDWTRIGTVQAKGESETMQYYSFKDQGPASGENLYRLKMIDHDNSSADSRIQILTFSKATSVYPNPLISGQLLNLETKDLSKISHVKIYDANGKQVYNSNKPTRQIDLNALGSGVYVVQITGTNGLVESHHIVKQ